MLLFHLTVSGIPQTLTSDCQKNKIAQQSAKCVWASQIHEKGVSEAILMKCVLCVCTVKGDRKLKYVMQEKNLYNGRVENVRLDNLLNKQENVAIEKSNCVQNYWQLRWKESSHTIFR